ncbi:MAG: DUF4214 domain-containing protein [Lachnospiraceae bacterium]|nr:DUF4214 domain-containing protein [Lachnospiraceae bacterium]
MFKKILGFAILFFSIGICFDQNVKAGENFDSFLLYDIENEPESLQAVEYTPQDESAQEHVWAIINNYVDKDYYMNDPLRGSMTDEQYETLKLAALNASANCNTQLKKIKAIQDYIAQRVFYDYVYSDALGEGRTDLKTNVLPYDVFTNKRAICEGFNNLTVSMMIAAGIPTMPLESLNHAYCACYDSDTGKWVETDSTWACKNKVKIDPSTGKEEWYYSSDVRDQYFNMTPGQRAAAGQHTIYEIPGIRDNAYNDVYYTLIMPKDVKEWSTMNKWYLRIDAITGTTCNAVSSVGNAPVKGALKNYAFSGSKVTSVDLSRTYITEIGVNTFYDCKNLEKVIFPETLTTIGDNAFANCSSLEDITFKSKQSLNIGKKAFALGAMSNKDTYITTTLSPEDFGVNNTSKGIYTGRNLIFGRSRQDELLEQFIKRMYEGCLLREADKDGLNYWVNGLKTWELNGAKVGAHFFTSEEFVKNDYDDATFLKLLYNVMMGRVPDARGREYWMGLLEGGVGRQNVVQGFIYSDEYEKLCERYGISRGDYVPSEPSSKNRGLSLLIGRMYDKCLNRDFDRKGMDYWCNSILTKQKSVIDVCTEGFFFSEEYLKKNVSDEEYISDLYRAFMGREKDDKGFAYWLGTLKNGEKDRRTILRDFGYSNEFKAILSSFGF